MEPEELEQWMRRMGALRGKERLAEREAAGLIGWTRESLRSCLAGRRAPNYIGYACKWLEQEARRGMRKNA